MKRTALISFILAALTMQAWADNYFTIGAGSVTFSPGDTVTVPVRAHFEGRLNQWYMTITLPDGLEIASTTAGPDMSIDYTDVNGVDRTENVNLLYSPDISQVSAKTSAFGYFDMMGNGEYMPYGYIKWEAGDYSRMFEITFVAGNGLKTGDVINFDGRMIAAPDLRGGTINNYGEFNIDIAITMDCLKGDVNGDGAVNITDVTTLIGLVLNAGDAIDAAQLPAADVNGDGAVNITDVTQLVGLALNAR